MVLKYFAQCMHMLSILQVTTAFDVKYKDHNLNSIPTTNTIGVTSLTIIGGNIPVIPKQAFINYTSLTYLSLSHNGIKYIEDGAFDHVNLTSLHLAHNSIEQLPISSGRLTYSLFHIGLNRAFNSAFKLTSPYFNEFDRLTYLRYESIDPYTYFNASALPKYLLKVIIIDTFLDVFPNLPHYTHLHIIMNNCGISYIPMLNMKKLIKLKLLELDGNGFLYLPDISFMTQLSTLSLRENKLNTLPNLYDCPLGTLRLRGNPLVCNYSLCWVRMWPFVKPALTTDDPVCFQPFEDAGTLLMGLDPVKMRCYEGRQTNDVYIIAAVVLLIWF